MFKTNSIKNISVTLVSLSMFLGAYLASPVANAFAKFELEDTRGPAETQASKEFVSSVVTSPITMQSSLELTESYVAGSNAHEVGYGK